MSASTQTTSIFSHVLTITALSVRN